MAFSSGVTALCTFEPLVTTEVLLKTPLPVRMSICLFGNDAGFTEEAPASLEGVLPGIDGLKFFLDGSLGASTAAVSGSYADGTVAEPEFDTDLQNIARALQKIPSRFRSEISRQTVSFIGLLYNFLKKK